MIGGVRVYWKIRLVAQHKHYSVKWNRVVSCSCEKSPHGFFHILCKPQTLPRVGTVIHKQYLATVMILDALYSADYSSSHHYTKA